MTAALAPAASPLPTSRLRLVAGFLVLSLGSLLTLALLTTLVAGRVISQQANDRVTGTAEQTGLYVGQVVDSEIALVNSYSRRAYIADAAGRAAPVDAVGGAHAVLIDLASSGGLRGATLLRADGTTVDTVLAGSSASSLAPAEPVVALARAFAQVTTLGTATVEASADDRRVLVIAVPVPTATGSLMPPAGVLAVTYRLDALQTSLDDFAETQSLGLVILDRSGRAVLSSPRGSGGRSAPGTADVTARAGVPGLGWSVTTRLPESLVNSGVTDLRDAAITVTLALAALCLLGVRVLDGALRQRQVAEEKLQYMALHDALTGLPNRVLFADRLERALSLAERSRRSLAVVAVDLNDFKVVNDTLGHQQGDLYLRVLAARLRTTLRDSDTAARMGGDEFAVLALDIDSSGVAELTARLEAALSEPWVFGDHRLGYGASTGIALFPENGRSADELMRYADISMYEVKHQRIARGQIQTPAGVPTAIQVEEVDHDPALPCAPPAAAAGAPPRKARLRTPSGGAPR